MGKKRTVNFKYFFTDSCSIPKIRIKWRFTYTMETEKRWLFRYLLDLCHWRTQFAPLFATRKADTYKIIVNEGKELVALLVMPKNDSDILYDRYEFLLRLSYFTCDIETLLSHTLFMRNFFLQIFWYMHKNNNTPPFLFIRGMCCALKDNCHYFICSLLRGFF